MLAINNLQVLANYDAMKATLDIPQFCDYTMLHFYVGHEDWGADKNFYALRKRGAGNQFKYLPWDGENILGADVNNNRTANADVPSGLHTKLLLSPEYKLDFADRAHKALFNGGTLTPQAVSNRDVPREPAQPRHHRRDGALGVTAGTLPIYDAHASYTRNNQWLTEQGRLLNTYFRSARPSCSIIQIRRALSLVSAPSESIRQPHRARVRPDDECDQHDLLHARRQRSRVYGTGAISAGARLCGPSR